MYSCEFLQHRYSRL